MKNVVFMGMGEPLDDPVIDSVMQVSTHRYFAFSHTVVLVELVKLLFLFLFLFLFSIALTQFRRRFEC